MYKMAASNITNQNVLDIISCGRNIAETKAKLQSKFDINIGVPDKSLKSALERLRKKSDGYKKNIKRDGHLYTDLMEAEFLFPNFTFASPCSTKDKAVGASTGNEAISAKKQKFCDRGDCATLLEVNKSLAKELQETSEQAKSIDVVKADNLVLKDKVRQYMPKRVNQSLKRNRGQINLLKKQNKDLRSKLRPLFFD